MEFDITAEKRSGGTFCLGLIICLLIYGLVYLDFKSLRNKNTAIIFSGFDLISTVSVGFVFFVGTVVFTIFFPHFMIPSLGFALIAFTIYCGMNVIIFDHANNTVAGLFESDTAVRFENIEIEFRDDDQIQLRARDSGKRHLLKRAVFNSYSWMAIIKILIASPLIDNA